MAPWLLLLAISVKQEGTRLRSGCSPDDNSLATLSSGAAVTIRYAISGESTPCYKVAVESGGKSIEGYLSASEIQGIEDFEQERRSAARVSTGELLRAIRNSAAFPPAPGIPKGIAGDAMQLIDSGQPARALAMLEPEIRKKKDAGLLAIAGVAAWKADDLRRALDYWRGSLELQPNPDLEGLIHRVEREAQADQSSDKLVGMRVVLRYDGVAVKTETARQMISALDEEYFRISQQLGCFAQEKIVAIVQTQDAYRAATDSAEWSGGQFDGRIRVPVLGGQPMDANMRRVFAHETVHACLAMLGRWPAWLHEGVAQRLSGETVRPAMRQRIADMIRAHQLPRLEELGQNWSRMDADHAAAAYALSLMAAELIPDIVNLTRNPERLAAVTAGLDKRLGL